MTDLSSPLTKSGEGKTPRQTAMGLLARAEARELANGLIETGIVFEYTDLRSPEVGVVMLRGRIGGDGTPFNVGEATVTRASIRLASGEVGFSYILGHDPDKARLAAICDALWQSETHRDAIEAHVLAPVKSQQALRHAHERARTAATRVDFFTMVRGED